MVWYNKICYDDDTWHNVHACTKFPRNQKAKTVTIIIITTTIHLVRVVESLRGSVEVGGNSRMKTVQQKQSDRTAEIFRNSSSSII